MNAGSNFKGLLLLTCVNALLYNVVHYLMIQRTSAVTTTVLGEIKIIGLLFASAFLLGLSPCSCSSSICPCIFRQNCHLCVALACQVQLPLTSQHFMICLTPSKSNFPSVRARHAHCKDGLLLERLQTQDVAESCAFTQLRAEVTEGEGPERAQGRRAQ